MTLGISCQKMGNLRAFQVTKAINCNLSEFLCKYAATCVRPPSEPQYDRHASALFVGTLLQLQDCE